MAVLVVWGGDGTSHQNNVTLRGSASHIIAAYAAPVYTRYVLDSQEAALATYEVQNMMTPDASQFAAFVVYATRPYTAARDRAWSFTLDGHPFYVLDLSDEGTFVYDMSTGAWAQFKTEGYPNWNMHNGTEWGGGRVAGGDADTGYVWELDPDATEDEDFRDISHVVTGGLATRSRLSKTVEHLTLTASAGVLSDMTTATISLRYSDDQGQTFSPYLPITLDPSNFSQEIAWRSIGSYRAPGRIFEVSDVGGVIRIDGATAGIDDFDEDNQQ